MIIPKNEDRKFKTLILENGLKVILVRTLNQSKDCYCAISVGAGCYYDPYEYQGLSHFLEHMLFMGSKKYPNENHFENRLNSLSGSYNAFTDSRETVYYILVNQFGLHEILDIFSRFFIDPLFKKDSINREIKAIHSEHSKNLQNDEWRLQRGVKNLANKKHEFNKFGTGNLKTLNKKDLLTIMVEYFNKYYCANNMTICLTSSYSFEKMQLIIKKYFKQIKSGNVEIPKLSSTIFPNDILSNHYQFYPINNINKINFIWSIDKPFINNDYKYLDIISYIWSQENKEGIYYYLFEQGWCKDISAYNLDKNNDFGIYAVQILLTPLGFEYKEHIIKLVQLMINQIINLDLTKISLFYQEIAQLNFDWGEQISPLELTIKLSQNCFYYQFNEVYSGSYLVNKIDIPKMKKWYTKTFIKNKPLIIITSKHNFPKKYNTEKYYGIKWSPIQINSPDLNKIFKVNINKKYIPKTIELKNDQTNDKPILIKKKPYELWYHFDSLWKLPNAKIILDIASPNLFSTPKNYILTNIMIEILNYYFNSYLFSAVIANYNFKLFSKQKYNSIGLYVHGFNSGIFILLQDILSSIQKGIILNDTQYKSFLENYKLKLENIQFMSPREFSSYLINLQLCNNQYSYSTLLNELKKITIKDIIKYKLLKETTIRIFLFGNINIFSDDIFDTFTLKSGIIKSLIYKPLKNISIIHPNKKEQNNFVGLYYPIGIFQPQLYSKLLILVTILSEPFFDELRTKEQLGYIVSLKQNVMLDNYFISLEVQSNVKNCSYLKKRILKFVASSNKILNELTKKIFEEIKNSLIKRLEEKDITFEEQFYRFWNEIEKNKFLFNRKDKIKKAVKKISKEDIINFYNNFLVNNKPIISKINSENN